MSDHVLLGPMEQTGMMCRPHTRAVSLTARGHLTSILRSATSLLFLPPTTRSILAWLRNHILSFLLIFLVAVRLDPSHWTSSLFYVPCASAQLTAPCFGGTASPNQFSYAFSTSSAAGIPAPISTVAAASLALVHHRPADDYFTIQRVSLFLAFNSTTIYRTFVDAASIAAMATTASISIVAGGGSAYESQTSATAVSFVRVGAIALYDHDVAALVRMSPPTGLGATSIDKDNVTLVAVDMGVCSVRLVTFVVFSGNGSIVSSRVKTIAGANGVACGSALDDSDPLKARFVAPTCVAVDRVSGRRNIYVCDQATIRVLFGGGIGGVGTLAGVSKSSSPTTGTALQPRFSLYMTSLVFVAGLMTGTGQLIAGTLTTHGSLLVLDKGYCRVRWVNFSFSPLNATVASVPPDAAPYPWPNVTDPANSVSTFIGFGCGSWSPSNSMIKSTYVAGSLSGFAYDRNNRLGFLPIADPGACLIARADAAANLVDGWIGKGENACGTRMTASTSTTQANMPAAAIIDDVMGTLWVATPGNVFRVGNSSCYVGSSAMPQSYLFTTTIAAPKTATSTATSTILAGATNISSNVTTTAAAQAVTSTAGANTTATTTTTETTTTTTTTASLVTVPTSTVTSTAPPTTTPTGTVGAVSTPTVTATTTTPVPVAPPPPTSPPLPSTITWRIFETQPTAIVQNTSIRATTVTVDGNSLATSVTLASLAPAAFDIFADQTNVAIRKEPAGSFPTSATTQADTAAPSAVVNDCQLAIMVTTASISFPVASSSPPGIAAAPNSSTTMPGPTSLTSTSPASSTSVTPATTTARPSPSTTTTVAATTTATPPLASTTATTVSASLSAFQLATAFLCAEQDATVTSAIPQFGNARLTVVNLAYDAVAVGSVGVLPPASATGSSFPCALASLSNNSPSPQFSTLRLPAFNVSSLLSALFDASDPPIAYRGPSLPLLPLTGDLALTVRLSKACFQSTLQVAGGNATTASAATTFPANLASSWSDAVPFTVRLESRPLPPDPVPVDVFPPPRTPFEEPAVQTALQSTSSVLSVLSASTGASFVRASFLQFRCLNVTNPGPLQWIASPISVRLPVDAADSSLGYRFGAVVLNPVAFVLACCIVGLSATVRFAILPRIRPSFFTPYRFSQCVTWTAGETIIACVLIILFPYTVESAVVVVVTAKTAVPRTVTICVLFLFTCFTATAFFGVLRPGRFHAIFRPSKRRQNRMFLLREEGIWISRYAHLEAARLKRVEASKASSHIAAAKAATTASTDAGSSIQDGVSTIVTTKSSSVSAGKSSSASLDEPLLLKTEPAPPMSADEPAGSSDKTDVVKSKADADDTATAAAGDSSRSASTSVVVPVAKASTTSPGKPRVKMGLALRRSQLEARPERTLVGFVAWMTWPSSYVDAVGVFFFEYRTPRFYFMAIEFSATVLFGASSGLVQCASPSLCAAGASLAALVSLIRGILIAMWLPFNATVDRIVVPATAVLEFVSAFAQMLFAWGVDTQWLTQSSFLSGLIGSLMTLLLLKQFFLIVRRFLPYCLPEERALLEQRLGGNLLSNVLYSTEDEDEVTGENTTENGVQDGSTASGTGVLAVVPEVAAPLEGAPVAIAPVAPVAVAVPVAIVVEESQPKGNDDEKGAADDDDDGPPGAPKPKPNNTMSAVNDDVDSVFDDEDGRDGGDPREASRGALGDGRYDVDDECDPRQGKQPARKGQKPSSSRPRGVARRGDDDEVDEEVDPLLEAPPTAMQLIDIQASVDWILRLRTRLEEYRHLEVALELPLVTIGGDGSSSPPEATRRGKSGSRSGTHRSGWRDSSHGGHLSQRSSPSASASTRRGAMLEEDEEEGRDTAAYRRAPGAGYPSPVSPSPRRRHDDAPPYDSDEVEERRRRRGGERRSALQHRGAGASTRRDGDGRDSDGSDVEMRPVTRRRGPFDAASADPPRRHRSERRRSDTDDDDVDGSGQAPRRGSSSRQSTGFAKGGNPLL